MNHSMNSQVRRHDHILERYTDMEIAVVRNQLLVLCQQVARPGFTPTDWLALTALASE